MFSVHSVLTGKTTVIKVSYKDNVIEFTVSPILALKDKPGEELSSQFLILNAYLDHKGDNFKQGLFNIMSRSYDIVLNTLDISGIDPLPYDSITGIIDYLDINDIYNFVKNVYRVVPPSNLQDSFDELIEKDAKGSRDQTYTKDDYLHLVALIQIIKVTIGPLCFYGSIKQSELVPAIKEYILYHIYKDNDKLMSYPPMIKIGKFVEQIIKQCDEGVDGDRIKVIDKAIPLEEYPIYMASILIIQKLSIATIVDDNEKMSVVNIAYNYIKSKLNSSSNTAKTIRDKEPMSDIDSANGDKESIAESLRIHGELAPGMAIEMDWAINTIDKVLHQLPSSIKDCIQPEVLQDAIRFSKEFKTYRIGRCNIDLLAFIFKSILDPRSLDYIKLDSMINLIAVGFSYLWGIGYKHIAVLLMSRQKELADDVMSYSSTINKQRVSKELKEQLDKFFPYKKVVNKDTTENVCEKAIGNLAKEYESYDWKTLVDEKYQLEGPIVPIDLKLQLLEFIITNERITYDGNYNK